MGRGVVFQMGSFIFKVTSGGTSVLMGGGKGGGGGSKKIVG